MHYMVTHLIQMGVGGDDSWGAPVNKKYLISSTDDIDFSFIISRV